MPKFIKFRRISDGFCSDMTEREWDRVQRDRERRKQFEFIELIDTNAPNVAVAPGTHTNPAAVVDTNTLECPLCGKKYKTIEGLKTHKSKEHA